MSKIEKTFQFCDVPAQYEHRTAADNKTNSPVLVRLLTQTIEASKKRNKTVRMTNI